MTQQINKVSQQIKKWTPRLKKQLLLLICVIVAIGIGLGVWFAMKPSGPGIGFASGNGRIEATEIDIAAKLAGRIVTIMVNEGDFVHAGQPLAQMQTDVLDSQLNEAQAQSRQAVSSVANAKAQVEVSMSDAVVAIAAVAQRQSDLDAATRRLSRTEPLSKTGIVGVQEVDDDRARVTGAQAALNGAKAQLESARSSIDAAKTQVIGAGFSVAASNATVAKIEADIQDSLLKSPRDGRVQYRIAQPGEVLAAGGKVLNVVDLGDVYMTFFLPETAVGKVALGSDVRIVLDAAPQYVISAKVSYVSSTAQFTPKTVETASERQKLMFRVKAQISPELLQKQLKLVKTGLPGIAWVKIDSQAKWPANLIIKEP